MTRPDFVAAARKKFDLTLPVAEQVVSWFFGTIADQIESGGSVVIRGFGSFQPRHHPPANKYNPRTGLVGVSAAKTSLHFVPSEGLVERLSKSPPPIASKRRP